MREQSLANGRDYARRGLPPSQDLERLPEGLGQAVVAKRVAAEADAWESTESIIDPLRLGTRLTQIDYAHWSAGCDLRP
jgi:hypothetical protein